MKLLFDENRSCRLVRELTDIYPDSAHVRDLGLRSAKDEMIWTHSARGGFLLTSKDADFYQRSIAFAAPPQVISLRVGNSPTSAIATLLRQRYVAVRRFHEDANATFLPLG